LDARIQPAATTAKNQLNPTSPYRTWVPQNTTAHASGIKLLAGRTTKKTEKEYDRKIDRYLTETSRWR
jgi:hypothetical protein